MPTDPARAPDSAGPIPVPTTLVVNGEHHELTLEPRRTLADVLRDDLGLTGTHLGCEHGVCGACTVLVDGQVVRSCLAFGVQFDGVCVETVEGLAHGDELNALQTAFTVHGALQCGYCTPGFLMLATALLRRTAAPTDEGIREAVASNLCRCTGYHSIVDAIRDAAFAASDAPPPVSWRPAVAAAPLRSRAVRVAGVIGLAAVGLWVAWWLWRPAAR